MPGADKSATSDDRQSALLAVTTHQDSWIKEHIDRLKALPAHGNRTLGIHHLFQGLLMSFFDPMARSLRAIHDAGNFDGRLDLPCMPRSTTSDALGSHDAAHLQPLLRDLHARAPIGKQSPELSSITRQIIAGDGTYFTVMADTAWALLHTKTNGKKQAQVRANMQMDVNSWAPQVITVSGDDGKSEPQAFAENLLHGVLYIFDRNFLEFNFLHQVLKNDNDFVLRVRANAPAMRVVRELMLAGADVAAGVMSDQIVELTGRGAPSGPFRCVTIQTTNRHGKPEIIRLLTNLTDAAITASVIGAIYRKRWEIELFFKWLKTCAGMDHLLSHSRNGILFQLYVMMIAVLMMYLQTGRRVSKYILIALSRFANGQCTLAQTLETIKRRNREADLNRARQEERRTRKKLA